MKLRIVGKSSDDKGRQLEELTTRLLRRQGYRNIALNLIGSGGNEVDVRAQFTLPGLKDSTIALVGECKAHESTIGLPDWLKFLGKVFTESVHSASQVRGVLIALSGANGNVIGALEAFKAKRTDIQLVQGDDLVSLLIQEFALPTTQEIVTKLRTLTDLPTTELSLVYYEGRCHWFAMLGNGTFTLVDQTERIHQDTVRLVQETVSAVKHVDLFKERESTKIAKEARGLVLSRLLLASSFALCLEDLLDESLEMPNLHRDDLDVAMHSLCQDQFLELRDLSVNLIDIETSGEQRAKVLRELTNGSVLLSLVNSDTWRSLIDEVLLDVVLEIQGNLPLPLENRTESLQMLRWSPSALAWAIRPDPMIVEHRNKEVGIPTIDLNDIMYFRQRLVRYASEDFSNPYLAATYFENDLRELALTTKAQFKSSKKLELDVEVVQRSGIYQAAPELGGGVIRVLMFAEAPEPWESPQPQGADASSPGDLDSEAKSEFRDECDLPES